MLKGLLSFLVELLPHGSINAGAMFQKIIEQPVNELDRSFLCDRAHTGILCYGLNCFFGQGNGESLSLDPCVLKFAEDAGSNNAVWLLSQDFTQMFFKRLYPLPHLGFRDDIGALLWLGLQVADCQFDLIFLQLVVIRDGRQ